MNRNSPLNRAILESWCPWCGMPPGEWCVTPSGTRASYLHAKRFAKAVYAGRLPLSDEEWEAGELSGEARD